MPNRGYCCFVFYNAHLLFYSSSLLSGRSAVALIDGYHQHQNNYEQQQQGSFLGLRRNDNNPNSGSGTYYMDHAGDSTHIGVFVSTTGGDGGTSNSAIFLAPGGDDAHHGTAEGDSSLDPDAAAGEGAYKTSGDPVPGGGGVAARRTMNEDEGMHHRQSTTTINNDGFNSTDEQEMILRTTNTAADRQQGSSSSSPPSSADLLDRGERSSGSLRWGGGEGGHSSYVESTGSFLSSIDETDLPN
jgi:hypothetical protein